MTITTDISIYELICLIFSVLGGGATLVAAGFALYQWRQSVKLNRAELIKEASSKIRDDKEIASVLYRIDYGEPWYDFNFIDNHEMEAEFDRVFAFFDYICYLRNQRILSRKDFKIFEYRIRRMACNEDFQTYFFNLYHFSKQNGTNISFYHLLKYLRKNDLLPEDFENKDSESFERLLNI